MPKYEICRIIIICKLQQIMSSKNVEELEYQKFSTWTFKFFSTVNLLLSINEILSTDLGSRELCTKWWNHIYRIWRKSVFLDPAQCGEHYLYWGRTVLQANMSLCIFLSEKLHFCYCDNFNFYQFKKCFRLCCLRTCCHIVQLVLETVAVRPAVIQKWQCIGFLVRRLILLWLIHKDLYTMILIKWRCIISWLVA